MGTYATYLYFIKGYWFCYYISIQSKWHLGSNSNNYLFGGLPTLFDVLTMTSYFLLPHVLVSISFWSDGATLWIILPTFDVMQPTNQPWSISVAIYFPQLTHQNRESRTTTSFYPWEFLHTTIISSGLTLGSYFRYESSMVGSIPMVTAIIGEMTIVFVITLQQACNLLPNESTIWDRGKIDCIVLFAKC